MKKLNHGLALMMSLLLCVTGSRVCLIANAEGAGNTEVNQEKVTEKGDVEESENVFIEDGILTEGINEIIEEPENDEKPESKTETVTTEPPDADLAEPADATDDIVILDEDSIGSAEDEATEEETTESAEDVFEVKEEEKDSQDITVSITFKVVNGSWDDGTIDDKTVTLTGEEGEELKLTADQIPAVGSNPADDTYKSGSWDKTPNTDESITEDATYIYTYSQKQKAVVLKAPEAKTIYVISEAQ